MSDTQDQGGRPSIYTPDLLDEARAYLSNWNEGGKVIPSHVDLALCLKISRSTLYEWGASDDKKEFSDILEEISQLQESELMNNGLSGLFNANITKLVLGKHGYKDTSEVTNKGAIPVDVIKQEYVKPK